MSDQSEFISFYDYNIDFSTRTLYLGYGAEVSEASLDPKLTAEMIKGLYLLDRSRYSGSTTNPTIHLIINCIGGDVDGGLAIYDTVRSLNSPVVATVVGSAWSMAVWILQAAALRRMTEHSSLMIHEGEGPKDGYSRKVDRICNSILLKRIQEKHPKFTRARLQRMLDKDTYLSADSALELGLIDTIVRKL